MQPLEGSDRALLRPLPQPSGAPLPPAPDPLLRSASVSPAPSVRAQQKSLGGRKIPSGGALLKQQLEVRARPDGRPGAIEVVPLPAELSFEKGFFVLVRAIQLLTSHATSAPDFSNSFASASLPPGAHAAAGSPRALPAPPPIVVVGLAGPSGAGKTELVRRLREFVPLTVLSLDHYVSETADAVDGNYDDPRLTDFDCLLQNIEALRSGAAAEAPIFDFKKRRRTGVEKVAMGESRVLLIEGIYALHAHVRPVLDLTVAIQGGIHFDLIKRIQRDVLCVDGEAPQDVIKHITDTVFPMFKTFIEADLQHAAIRIHNTFNPFGGFLNSATYTLKSAKEVPEERVEALFLLRENGPCVSEREDTVDLYLTPPGEDQETCRDWIRMRLREGRYSLLFEEYLSDGDLLISPSMSFEVPVRVLGGLMSLGYTIGAIIKRASAVFRGAKFSVKYDDILQLDKRFFQIEGRDRAEVEAAGAFLQLNGTFVPRSYIEQVQLERLLQECSPALDEFLSGAVDAGADGADGGAGGGAAERARLEVRPTPPSPGGTGQVVSGALTESTRRRESANFSASASANFSAGAAAARDNGRGLSPTDGDRGQGRGGHARRSLAMNEAADGEAKAPSPPQPPQHQRGPLTPQPASAAASAVAGGGWVSGGHPGSTIWIAGGGGGGGGDSGGGGGEGGLLRPPSVNRLTTNGGGGTPAAYNGVGAAPHPGVGMGGGGGPDGLLSASGANLLMRSTRGSATSGGSSGALSSGGCFDAQQMRPGSTGSPGPPLGGLGRQPTPPAQESAMAALEDAVAALEARLARVLGSAGAGSNGGALHQQQWEQQQCMLQQQGFGRGAQAASGGDLLRAQQQAQQQQQQQQQQQAQQAHLAQLAHFQQQQQQALLHMQQQALNAERWQRERDRLALPPVSPLPPLQDSLLPSWAAAGIAAGAGLCLGIVVARVLSSSSARS